MTANRNDGVAQQGMHSTVCCGHVPAPHLQNVSQMRRHSDGLVRALGLRGRRLVGAVAAGRHQYGGVRHEYSVTCVVYLFVRARVHVCLRAPVSPELRI